MDRELSWDLKFILKIFTLLERKIWFILMRIENLNQLLGFCKENLFFFLMEW